MARKIECYLERTRKFNPYLGNDSTVKCMLMYPFGDEILLIRVELGNAAGFKFRKRYCLGKRFSWGLFYKLVRAAEQSYNAASYLASGFHELRWTAYERFEIRICKRSAFTSTGTWRLVFNREVKNTPKQELKILQKSILNILGILEIFEGDVNSYKPIIEYFLNQ